jgi:CheY-like chemotaxis protein
MMPINVLVIDDSPTVRQAIRFQLTSHGCRHFSEAANASQALDLIDKEHFDLVTLDLMMPALGGVTSEELFDKIRLKSPNAAIIVISSIPYDKVKSGYIEKGALAYIVKPLTKFSFEPARHRLRRIFAEFR